MLSVIIGVPDAALIEHWEDLRQRAAGNVFMHPVALAAAAALGFAQIHVLLAWFEDATSRRLVGCWALRTRGLRPLWPRSLGAPPYDYAFVANPVVDPAHADAVMAAFFKAIADDPALPKVLQLKSLDGDAASFPALMQAIGSRPMIRLSEQQRPFLNAASERKRSGSTGKKLRQDWNRLAALGAVEITNARTAPDVRAAFEIFLAMELHSWKGRHGTALLSDDDDAAFARRLIADLAAHRGASVALLRVDGKPIAAQVLLYDGTTAYTWKTAYDPEFAKFSPGALLVDKITDELFAAGIERFESCSPDGGFMAQLWTGRRTTIDLLVDVGPARSLAFRLAALGERCYARLREARNRLRALPVSRRKSLAATRG